MFTGLEETETKMSEHQPWNVLLFQTLQRSLEFTLTSRQCYHSSLQAHSINSYVLFVLPRKLQEKIILSSLQAHLSADNRAQLHQLQSNCFSVQQEQV